MNDELIGQIYSWLEEADDSLRIEALLDLPDLDWVEIRAMSDRGDLMNLTYRGLSLVAFTDGLVEMVCPRDAVKAIRRRPRHRLDHFLSGAGNEKSAPAEAEMP